MKKITIITCIAIPVIAYFTTNNNDALSRSNGSPGSYSSSPGDANKDCTYNCHGGSASVVTGWITSTIPVTGYVPLTTYTISVTSSGVEQKGFEVTAENSSNNKVGTFIAGMETKLVNSSKAVTHQASSATNPKTWTFQWTAPATGLGPVTFYGSFALGKLITKNTTYVVPESNVGLNENSTNSNFAVYPNPIKDKLYINYSVETASKVEIYIYSLEGKKVASLFNSEKESGSYIQSYDLNNIAVQGVYVVNLKIADKSFLKKIVIE